MQIRKGIGQHYCGASADVMGSYSNDVAELQLHYKDIRAVGVIRIAVRKTDAKIRTVCHG